MQKKSFILDPNFYSQERVTEALNAFEDFDISFENGILTLSYEDAQAVFDEFSNYCLALQNELLV